MPPAHHAGSTEIERNDEPEVSQQDEGPARTSSDNGEAASTEAEASDQARPDDQTAEAPGAEAETPEPAPASPPSPSDDEAAGSAAAPSEPAGTTPGATDDSAVGSTPFASSPDATPEGAGPAASPETVTPRPDHAGAPAPAAPGGTNGIHQPAGPDDTGMGTDPPGSVPGAGAAPLPPTPPATSGPTETPTSPYPPIDPSPTQPAYDIRTTVVPAPVDAPTEQMRRGGAYADDERVAPRPQPTGVEDPAAAPSPGARPRHMRQAPVSKPATGVDPDERRRRRNLMLAVSPVFIVLLIVVAWAVDTVTLSGQVLRNVTLAGDGIGGSGEDALAEQVAEMADQLAARPVVIEVQPQAQGFAGNRQGQAEPRRYETTAGDLGLTLDAEATVEAALDVGRGDSLVIRPFKWLASFLSSREAPLEYRMSEAQTVATLQVLQGTDQQAPVEPTITLQENQFVAVAGHPGTGLDASQVADALLAAVEGSDSLDDTVEISARQTEVAPRIPQADAEALATRANEITANGLTLKAADVEAVVPPEQLRQWIGPVPVEEGEEFHLDLTFNSDAATQAAPGVLSELAAEPENATVALQGGRPVVQPGRPGATCCGDDAGDRMWEALQAGETEVTVEVEAQEPEHTTEEVQGWGIAEPIGGARAHRDGADVGGPAPGYTTYHDCCASRVTNIHLIAEETNGAIIPPDGTFSLNDHVGPRTADEGYVAAGAIRDGEHVDEIGGGVSQFFTTLFNAAYFGGLDIVEYQAHSENFPRYPDGREATGGHPNPDLVIHNNTPHGVLIQTSYTDTSVTVTLWSTPYATAEQTGLSSSPAGAVCTNVVSTRTRTYPDGTSEQDSFEATYRPEGRFCDGTPVGTQPPG